MAYRLFVLLSIFSFVGWGMFLIFKTAEFVVETRDSIELLKNRTMQLKDTTTRLEDMKYRVKK